VSVDNFLLSASATDLNYPEIRPSLDLNFARTKTLDPRITFTRSSGGSYVGADGLIKYAGVNEARFDHNPVTGESLGLLIEEGRTNLILNSTTLSSHSTTLDATRTLTSETTSPDGTFNAYKIIGNSGSTLRQALFSHIFTMNANTSYTISVFLKGTASRRYATLWFDNTPPGNAPVEGPFYGSGSFIDLLTGTSSNPSITKMIPYGNGWYRCYVTATVGASNLTNVYLQVSIGNPNNFIDTGTPNIYKNVGDGSSGIYYWGPQLEVGAFPTSYIPTQASTVTRFADVARITGTNFSSWYRQDEGTVFADAKRDFAVPSGPFPRVYQIQEATGASRVEQSYYTGGQVNYIPTNGVIQAEWYPAYFIQNGVKSAQALAANNIAGASNGVLTGTDTSASLPTVDQIRIGTDFSTINVLNGTIRRLTYWPKRLPNSQLRALTR
jgi:hypothetical protein